MLTGHRGAALLEYFRNLTPQILFLACTLYVAVQLEPWTFSLAWESVKLTSICLACLGLFCLSLLTNVMRFLDSFVSGNEQLDDAMEFLRGQEGGLLRKMPRVAAAAWRFNKRGVFEAVLVVAVSYAGMVPVATMAMHSAVSLLSAGR